ncbi:CotH kinase family protein [candidate division KSB1 bacterium]|nr:CotH kinase family protein [candidate division KSB1 bacterium]
MPNRSTRIITYFVLIVACFMMSTVANSREHNNSHLSPLMLSYQSSVVELVPIDATKHVLVPEEDIGDLWYENINYDDSNWKICSGNPPFIGYDRGNDYDAYHGLDMEEEMYGKNTTCYIRIPFTVNSTDLDEYKYLMMYVAFDDGYIAYLNGKRIAGIYEPETPLWNSQATVNLQYAQESFMNMTEYKSELVVGENLLAIHGLNNRDRNSRFLIGTQFVLTNDLYGDFKSSNLPIVIIDTKGIPILDDLKITAHMKVVNNGSSNLNRPDDDTPEYDGQIGIEIRGKSSASYPQTPYALETRDDLGENLNISLLGMPPENDWHLISNFNEKSLMRNTLAFDLFREMGHYAPRARLCEVVVDYQYRGIYVFTEKIKRDNNRVNISTLNQDEITGDDLTGGYIFKVDYSDNNDSWKSNYSPINHPGRNVYFVYYYPKPDEIVEEQKTYIQNFIDAFESSLQSEQFADPDVGYPQYIDVPSFIDYFILSEVSRNIDGSKKSRFFYKDRDSKGGLLHAGPVWDFDWAWKNIRECHFANTDGSGWSYRVNDCYPDRYAPDWYVRLVRDSTFTTRLINRYEELRTNVLDLGKIDAYIDSVKTNVQEAQLRHFAIWPINWGWGAPEVEAPPTSYDEEVERLRAWIKLRISWLDSNIPYLRNEIVSSVLKRNQAEKRPASCRIFPNPAFDFFSVVSESPIKKMQIYNVLGQQVFESDYQNSNSVRIQVDCLRSGTYFVKIALKDNTCIVHKQIIRK